MLKKEADRAARAHFAALVRRTREALGHSTARAFFDSQGGCEFFGCGYRTYLNVESGAGVPQPALVERLAAALRIALDPGTARAFAHAYLRVLLGFEDVLGYAVEALAEPATEPPDAEALTVELDPGQAQGLYANEAAYWCFMLLCESPKPLSAPELSSKLELEGRETDEALEWLAAAKLVARRGEGYEPSRPGARIVYPQDAGEGARALERHRGSRLERGGDDALLHHPFLMLASEGELRRYFPCLSQAVSSAQLCATRGAEADASLYLVEATVRRVFPF